MPKKIASGSPQHSGSSRPHRQAGMSAISLLHLKAPVYAVSSTGMYRLPAGATAWTRIHASVPTTESLMPMVENQGVLYIVSADAIFASTDNGQTWNAFCPRPKGYPVGLIVMDTGQDQRPQAGITLYLALRDAGIFRSTDGGTHWASLKNGLIDERISAVARIGKTVFAGTNRGLYRLDSDFWKRLPVPTAETIYSMTVLKKNLYVGTGARPVWTGSSRCSINRTAARSES